MDFETARRVLLAASLEEADKAGETVPHTLRRQAGDAAPEPGEADGDETFTTGEEAFFAARAEHLLGALPGENVAAAGKRWPWWALVLLAALAIGFFSKDLGPSGRVNILSVPLLGMMVWSIAVYALALLRGLGKDRRHSRAAAFLSTAFTARDASPFARRWAELVAPLRVRRASAWLHAAAAALAVGAVGAMYYQGLVRDYQATWESTFLSAEQVRGLLSVALAPATWAPGLALPEVAGIDAIRHPDGERAAAWIHRYALAAAVVVIVPRLVLAALGGLRARRLQNTLPVRAAAAGYFKTLLAEKRGTKTVVRVVPHRTELDPRGRDALRDRLHAHWGGALWMDFLEPVAYGDEEEFSDRAAELLGSDHVAVVCGLNATPEEESQGRLLRAASAAAGEGGVLLVIEDGGFTARFGESRAGDRRAAWAKLAAGCGIGMLDEKPE